MNTSNERTYAERFDSGLDSRPLFKLADAEIAALKHDNERLMKSLNAEVNRHETPAPQAPIATLLIDEQGECHSVNMFSPGLPPGEHDVYLDPAAPGLQQETPAAREHWCGDPACSPVKETVSAQTFANGTHVRFKDEALDHEEWVVYGNHDGWVKLYWVKDRTTTHYALPEQLRAVRATEKAGESGGTK